MFAEFVSSERHRRLCSLPFYGEAHYQKARLLARLHNPPKTLESLKKALELDAKLRRRVLNDPPLKRLLKAMVKPLLRIPTKPLSRPFLSYKPLLENPTVPDMSAVIKAKQDRVFSYDPAKFRQLAPSRLAFINHGGLISSPSSSSRERREVLRREAGVVVEKFFGVEFEKLLPARKGRPDCIAGAWRGCSVFLSPLRPAFRTRRRRRCW